MTIRTALQRTLRQAPMGRLVPHVVPPSHGADLEVLARVGSFWIVLLAVTGLG